MVPCNSSFIEEELRQSELDYSTPRTNHDLDNSDLDLPL